MRTESRGAHSRLDHPAAGPGWEDVNVAVVREAGTMSVRRTPTLALSDALRTLAAR
jgi:succinate dehydrogenase/fumarate reductase flavoprotein subunit